MYHISCINFRELNTFSAECIYVFHTILSITIIPLNGIN
jgi:hypothetical protein